MLDDKRFWMGFGVGLVSVYVYHHFVKSLPAGKKSS